MLISCKAALSRARVGIGIGVLVGLAATGCDAGDGPGGLAEPEQRPSDGLLRDPELQAVVDAQVERDWESLAEDLSDERAAVRARAALALASVQAYQAVPKLVELLADADVAVRRDAAFALGQSAQRDAGEPILEALQHEVDPSVRHRLIEALGKIGFDEVLQGLVDLEVTGTDQADRLLAMARLGAIQGMVTEASQNALMEKLDDPDARARRNAAYFFGRTRDASSWAPRVARIRQAVDGYRAGDPATIQLVKALGRLNDPADVERLSGFATASPDWRVRVEAMSGLAGRELDDGSRGALMSGLDDESIHVAVRAANTLSGSTHLPSVLGRMASWIETNPERWQVAAPLLANLARQDQQEFVLGWIDGLAPDDEVHLEIGLRALGQMRGTEALERLQVAMNSESEGISGAAMIGLRQSWGRDQPDARLHSTYFEIFSRALASGRPGAVFVAAPVLADPVFASFGNTAVMLDALDAAELPEDVRIAQAIVTNLGQTGDPAVREALHEALQHPYADVRRAAATALAQHFGEEVQVPEGGLLVPADDEALLGADPTHIDWDYLAGLGPSPRFIMETDRGTLVIQMSTEEAPLTVQTVSRLAQQGRFDGTPFHRVVPNFVVQGGDVGAGDGSGGPGFAITTEITEIPYERGVIGMASAGKDTEGSQFFVVHSAQPHLDGGYTTFGWLVEGGEVLDAIAQGDVLLSARIETGG